MPASKQKQQSQGSKKKITQSVYMLQKCNKYSKKICSECDYIIKDGFRLNTPDDSTYHLKCIKKLIHNLKDKYPNFQGLPGYKDLTKGDQSSILETLRTIDSSVTPDDKNFIDDAKEFDGNASDASYGHRKRASSISSDSSRNASDASYEHRKRASSISSDSSGNRVFLNRSKNVQQPPRRAIRRGADDTSITSKPRSTSGGGNLGDAMRQPMSPEEQEKLKQDLISKNLASLIRTAQTIVDLVNPPPRRFL